MGTTGFDTMAYGGPMDGYDYVDRVTFTFDAMGLDSYTAGNQTRTRGTSVVSEAAGDSLVRVGRWNGGTTAGATPFRTYSATQGYHYAVGPRTAALPTSGTQDYTLLGATRPTHSDGTSMLGTITGRARVAWGAMPKIGVELTVTIPGDTTYTIQTPGGTASPGTDFRASTTGRFSFSTAMTGSSGHACSTMPSMCSAGVEGFVTGPNAERIALAFAIYAGNGGVGVHGAAALTR